MGAIDENLTQHLVRMAKFRNRLVHLYWELDKTEVYKIIKDNIQDVNLELFFFREETLNVSVRMPKPPMIHIVPEI